jgi:NAD(P)-dependent dehydrogenase (short-subunit alcohol dehydrogenase family)
MTFIGKVALVAGGTGGLGRAVSLAFLREGAELIVTYRNDQEFADLKSTAGASGSRLVGRHVDVTDEAAVQHLVAGIGAEDRRFDVLVNTVGSYVGGMKLWELDTTVLDQMLALNLRSGFMLSRTAAKAMLQWGKGAIKDCLALSGISTKFDTPESSQQ